MDDSLVGLACLHPSGWDLSFFPSLSLSHSLTRISSLVFVGCLPGQLQYALKSDHDEGQEL